MLTRRLTSRIAAVAALFFGATTAMAQGVTTGAISGTVTDPTGTPLQGAQVQVTNTTTGYRASGVTRENGQFLVQGLEVGGPYRVTVRRIGYQPHTRDNITVQLSQTSRVEVKPETQITQLNELEIRATTGEIIAPTNIGTKTTVSQQALERSATTTRNLVDFTRSAPQVSSSGPGYSGGGMSNRMNNVQIDGATERDVFGLGSTGQPGGQIGAKAISIDAVKEYQILLAPYDVRQGNFGGLLLNAVTKSGTNEFHGSLFNYYRNQDYGRNVPVLRATDFSRRQTGFSLGGPIIRDRLHFFTANEWTRETTPVSGPYFGQVEGPGIVAFGFSAAEVSRFEAAYRAKPGNPDPGTLGQTNTPTPMDNVFARLDFQISPAHRLVARFNYTDALNDNRRETFRSTTRGVYSSNFHSISSNKKAPVIQLFSNFRNGWSNEAFIGANWVRDRRNPKTTFPEIIVNYTGNRQIIAGADRPSQGNQLDADTYEFTNNLTIPFRQHSFVIGTRNELTQIRNLFNESAYGVWTFDSVARFEQGVPSGFRRAIVLSQDGNAYFDALQTAVYVQDSWTVNPKLTLTLGLRADNSAFLDDNSYAPAVDSAYGRKETAKGALQFSPRVGFNFDVTGDQINQLRGGIGLFVGTPPAVWMENAYVDNGIIRAVLTCGPAQSSPDPAPTFTPDASGITNCANGRGSKPIGNLSFLDPDLKFPQPMRANLAFDRVLPFNLVATAEILYSKTLNQLFFVNRNIAGPVGTDKFGRVMYGTISSSGSSNGQSSVVRPAGVIANGGSARFASAIEATNQSKDYAYNLTGQLRKRYANNWEAYVAYSYGRARDVQSFTSSTHLSNWQFGRTLSGRQEDAFTGISLFDQPHKISAFVTKTVPWSRLSGIIGSWASGLATDFTVSYQGVSGPPHDYVYGGSSNRGDMNADGSAGNDLIYVPTDATDQSQIRFGNLTAAVGDTLKAADQAAAFEQLIQMSPCLAKSRGQILARNSCRLPWSNNIDVTIRQNIPLVRSSQRVAFQLDIFNFGNLLNKKWGQQDVSPYSSRNNIPLLTHTQMSSSDPAIGVPTVTFNYRTIDPDKDGTLEPYTVGNFVANYWRMQISARVSF